MQPPPHELTPDHLRSFREDMARLASTLESAVVGQQKLIRNLLTAVIADGHVLVEGLPGLGKTHLVKGLARCFGLPLSRIQCTPDLLPSDITGSDILLMDAHGNAQGAEFRRGPVFAPMVLVDEINRAAPRTQSALLEAMQERQVTYAGTAHPLPTPFWMVATQNPIEIEGTYPLPEAQLDRFLFKLTVPFPTEDDLVSLATVSLNDEPTDHLPALIAADRLLQMRMLTREVVIAEDVKRAAARLVLATQPAHDALGSVAGEHVHYGASPRGLQALLRAARVLALGHERGHVSIADLEAVALPALRHRLLLRIRSEMEGVTPDTLILKIVEQWKTDL